MSTLADKGTFMDGGASARWCLHAARLGMKPCPNGYEQNTHWAFGLRRLRSKCEMMRWGGVTAGCEHKDVNAMRMWSGL